MSRKSYASEVLQRDVSAVIVLLVAATWGGQRSSNLMSWEEFKEAPSDVPRASRGLVVAIAEELTVAVFRHPACPSKVAVVDPPGAFGLGIRIEPKNHRNGLAPIGAVGRSVENAHIDLHVRSVIVRQFGAVRWSVEEIR